MSNFPCSPYKLIQAVLMCGFKRKKDRKSYDFYLWLSFLLPKASLYTGAEIADEQWQVSSCKCYKFEHQGSARIVKVDTQVSSGSHHPSCKMQVEVSFKH